MRAITLVRAAALVALLAIAPASLASSTAPTRSDATYTVAVESVPRAFVAEGVVEAVKQATVAAQVSGRIVEFPIRAGDTLRQGQLVARVDSRIADQAVLASRSQAAEAQARLANARRSYERSRQLLAHKFVSQAAVDQAESEFKAAEAQVAAMTAGVGQAVAQQSYTTIAAPFAGVVGATSVEVGDLAVPGRPLATLFDPRELRVVATLPQATLPQWKRDSSPVVELAAIGKTVAGGEVTVIPVADARTHTVRVRIALAPTEGALPGQYARVRFPVGTRDALAVPASAILRRGELTAVYVAADGDRPQLRQVRVGESFDDGRVEVLSGLVAGDRVFVQPLTVGMTLASHTAR